MGFMDRLKDAYDVLFNTPFSDKLSTGRSSVGWNYDNTSSAFSIDNVLAPIKTRIAIDCASVIIRHVMIDNEGHFLDYVKSELNDRLTVSANIDQTGRSFIQDAVMTLLDGHAVLVPVETSINPEVAGSYDILSVRVGTVTQWRNRSVVVNVYNEERGFRQDIELPKGFVAIAYNPLYTVMNQSNSTLRRLSAKLALMDLSDEQAVSPNIDVILQLPYSIKNEKRQEEADRRIEILENQLRKTRYGLAYVDSTEKITQLNRPVANTISETVQKLTETLHAQLGMSPSIFLGTATEAEQLVYLTKTIEPIIGSILDAMNASFFTRTAIRQGHRVMGFQQFFKMAPLAHVADAADKFTRNEILSPNEMRSVIGFPASKDPEADKLRNRNLNKESGQQPNGDTQNPNDLAIAKNTEESGNGKQ